MKQTLFKRNIIAFVVIGIIIGLVVYILAVFYSLFINSEPATFQGLVNIYKKSDLLWGISIIPFVFLGFSIYIGRNVLAQNKEVKEQIDKEVQKSERIFQFVEKLRKGQTDTDFKLIDEYDNLGKALVNLRDELKRSKEEEDARKTEEEQRHWITEGLAKFGAILRENINDLEMLSYEITSNLVRYIDAQQAGFFILQDNNGKKHFEMTASYAYGRKKFPDKIIEWGEGLVGACALEQKTIFIKETTENYVEITSGLGKANPRSLVIVPLKINDEVHGVIEIASFINYKEYQINFIERVAESIASTLSNVKINLRTAQLLKESQEQAEIMAKQEEEMMKNMEELKQTQIEAAKQSEQFISFTNSVNHTMIRAEYSVDGKLLYANTKFLSKLGYTSSDEINGKHISMFINEKDRPWFNDLWENLAKGGKHFEGDMKHVTKQGTDVWTMATYVSVRDHERKPQKILFLGIDVTESKKQSLDYKGQIDALNRSTLKAEYKPDGTIIEYNKKFLDTLNYEMEELKNKSIFDYIIVDEIDEFKIVWQNIITGVPFEGRHKRISKTGEERWFQGTYTVVHDMYGEPAKIVYIGTEITEQIRIELKNKEQTEVLKEQEQKLQQSKIELSKKLKETREEMKLQFREIETVKMLNEKTLEGMLDSIVSINQDDEIQFFNRAAEELWGLQREEVIGKNINILLPEEHKKMGENYLGNYFKFGDQTLKGKRTEVFIVDKFEQKVNVLLTLSEARIGSRYSLTAFIQRIEVELF